MSTKSRTAILSVALSFGALSALNAPPAQATVPDPHLVISEFYELGGIYDDSVGLGSTYNQDFLELYNPADQAVDPSGLYLYERLGGGLAEFGAPSSLAGAPMVPAHSHYLIELVPYGTPRHQDDGLPLPTPDFTMQDPDFALATNVQVMLLNSGDRPDFDSYCSEVDWTYQDDGTKYPTPAAYGCDWTSDPQVVDMVGTGQGGYETSAATAAGQAYETTQRVDDKTDTDSNANDFWVAGPSPQNSSSPDRTAVTPGAADVTAAYGSKPRLAITLTTPGPGPTPTGHVDLFNSDGSWLGDTEVGPTGVATYLAPAFSWAPGTYHLSYRYLGDATYTPAVGSFNVTVEKDVAQMSADPAAYSYGTPGEVDVTVTGENGSIPTGKVTLTEGTTTVAAGTLQHGAAYIAVPGTALSVGQHSLTATYPGDHGVGDASTTVDVTVRKATTSLTLTPPSQQVKQNTTATLKITAAAAGITPTGSVTVKDGTTTLATRPLDDSGQATFTLPKTLAVGRHTLNVSYPGDDFTLAATQHATVSVTQARTAPRLTMTTSPRTVVVNSTGASLAMHVTTADGAAATGNVTLTVLGTKHTLTLRSGRASLKLPAFPHTGRFTATLAYGGSTTLLAAKKSIAITVVKGAPHLTVTTGPRKVIRKKTRASIAVHITGPNGAAATGKVRITVRGTKHTLTLHRGRATLKLPTFPKAGRFTATITYGGSATLRSAKKSIKIIVVKR